MELNLQAIREGWSTQTLLDTMINRVFSGKIAVVSSFGIESAPLLHMVAQVDRTVPVIFLDTGKLFPETLRYRDTLVERLGLTRVRAVPPNEATLAAVDSDGTLWRSDPSLCCWARKVEPLDEALAGFEAWITGRKRFQGGKRSDLALVESGDDGRTKVNPLAFWNEADLAAYFAAHDLPRHPLEARGYRSIGCAVCTRPTKPGENPRAGRWSGTDKTECGIHDRGAVVDARGAGI
ncbi:MAG: phosphoadenylyl-sulfate reductase [Acetobacteraceae bacterium]|nr:phosphoadenylyl-sulfate reductase [Acetobacteraceae bacterium]